VALEESQESPESYEQIVEQHYRMVFGFLYRLCGQRDAAEDLTQETFMQLWSTPPTTADAAGVRRWLLTVARNRCISFYRRAVNSRGVDWESCAEPASEDPGPAATGMARERATQVRIAVAALPRVLREVLVLREFEELNYIEIGEILGVPVGTVRSRLSRARMALAQRLAPLKEKL